MFNSIPGFYLLIKWQWKPTHSLPSRVVTMKKSLGITGCSLGAKSLPIEYYWVRKKKQTLSAKNDTGTMIEKFIRQNEGKERKYQEMLWAEKRSGVWKQTFFWLNMVATSTAKLPYCWEERPCVRCSFLRAPNETSLFDLFFPGLKGIVFKYPFHIFSPGWITLILYPFLSCSLGSL